MPDFERPDFERPDFERPDFERPDFEREPSVEAVRRTDGFIDALAGGRPVAPQDAADAELAVLLGIWRDEMRWPPATDLISEADAVAALNAGKAQKRLAPGRDRWTVDTEITPRKNRRGLSVVGAAAAAVLCIGGFGAVVAGAGPGDGLYGLRTMLFGTPKEVRDDQVGLAAKTTLNQVQDLIAQGDWSQAQNKLVEVSTQVASIGDEQQKQDLIAQFNDLSAKVVERDPAATAPPGVIYTVPPSAAELVPAVAPGDSTTPTSGTSTPEAPTSASSASSASSGSSTTASPTESASPTDSASPSPTESTTSPEAIPTTTPTSAAPTAQATTAAPETAAATTAAPTTAVPPPPTQSAPQPTVQSEPQATVQSAAPVETPVQAPSADQEPPQPESGLTTTVIPVPAG